ncbi:MAG: hypothetical protein K6A68_00710 [Clostridiales bacterium]|nr:hypothetical protein [Clostridiales bacterium]
MKKYGWAILLCLLLFIFPAHADDAYTLSIKDTPVAETDKNYIRISCPLDCAGDVTVTVGDSSGNVVYQRYYPSCEDLFRSEDIYLKQGSSQASYTVEVRTGDASYRSEVVCKSARLEDNTACTAGYPLNALTGKSSWLSATLLDLSSLEGSSETYPVHASNAYTLGSVTFSLNGGNLRVSYLPPDSASVSVSSSTVEVALTSVDARALNTKSFHGIRSSLDTDIPVTGADIVCVLVRLNVSYLPDRLPGSPEITQYGQKERWEQMQAGTNSESNG